MALAGKSGVMSRLKLSGLGLALLFAALGATIASRDPDTLERFLDDEGIVGEEPAPAPFPGYTIEGVESERWSKILSGAAGVLATFGVLTLLVGLARRGSSPAKEAAGSQGSGSQGADSQGAEETNDRAS